MKLWHRFVRPLLQREDAQALPVVGLFMVVLLGMAGLAVDVGHAYLCQRELQASCDAAALAGATVIPTSTSTSAVYAVANSYGSSPGNKNVYGNMTNITMVAGYPVLKCLSSMQTQGISCVGYLPYNSIQVKQQALITTYFARLFGKPTMVIAASSTAAKGGGSSRPYNIAIMLDTTLSMLLYDADCGATQMACSLSGVQVLLHYLDPCGRSQATCTITAGNSANSVVRVSLFTFPQVTYPTVGYDSDCGSSTPTAWFYTFPPIGGTSYSPGTASSSTTYRVVDFRSDYRVSDTATVLNSSSSLTMAAGGVSGCAGMGVPANAGIYGTYYAPTIYAAQAALVQAQAANPGSQNVLIILGDGDANSPHLNGSYTVLGPGSTLSGTYPSWIGECGQAIDAAQFATAQGTTVYSVAYGSPPTGCVTDLLGGTHQNITPCNEMAQLASHYWDFFSDFKQSGSGSTCTAAQTMVALNDIFLQIAGDLTVARLIPDNTT